MRKKSVDVRLDKKGLTFLNILESEIPGKQLKEKYKSEERLNSQLKEKYYKQTVINYSDLNRIDKLGGVSGKLNSNIIINKLLSHEEEEENTNRFFNLKRRLRKEKRKVRDSLEDEEELEIHQDNYPKFFVIYPESDFKQCWDILIVLITLFTVIYSPLVLAFNEMSTPSLDILEITFDLFCLIDIFISFFTAFYNEDEELILNNFSIFNHYFRTWFSFDLLSSIPISTIFYFGEFGNIGHISSLSKFAKIYRILKFMRMLKLMNLFRHSKKIQRVKFVEELNLSNGLKRFIEFGIGFLVISHILTCIWIFLASLDDENWIAQSKLQDESPYEVYIASLYFNLTTIFTIGYGDILSVNIYERLFNIFIMIVGVLLFSFTVSSLGNIITTYDKLTQNYMNNLDLLDEIRLKYPVINKQVPEEKVSIIDNVEVKEIVYPSETLYDKLSKYLHYEYKTNKYEKFKLINDLPVKIKNELIYRMYRNYIENFSFFHYSYQDGRHDAFNTKVILSMRPVRIFKNEHIIKEGETVQEMFFVKNGVLSVDLNQEYLNLPILALRKNDYFGVIQVLNNEKSDINVRVKSTHAEIFLIKKNDLFQISIDFPQIFKEIFKNSSLNYTQLKQIIEIKKQKIDHERKLEEYSKSISSFKEQTIYMNQSHITEKKSSFFFPTVSSSMDNTLNDNISGVKFNNANNDLREKFSNKKTEQNRHNNLNHNKRKDSNPSRDSSYSKFKPFKNKLSDINTKNSIFKGSISPQENEDKNTKKPYESYRSKKNMDEKSLDGNNSVMSLVKDKSERESIRKSNELTFDVNIKKLEEEEKRNKKEIYSRTRKENHHNHKMKYYIENEQNILNDSVISHTNESINIENNNTYIHKNAYELNEESRKILGKRHKNMIEDYKLSEFKKNVITNVKQLVKTNFRENLVFERNPKLFITNNVRNLLSRHLQNEKQPFEEMMHKLDSFYYRFAELESKKNI